MSKRKITFKNIVYTSAKMDRIVKTAKRVASSDTYILITGESGTGKEVLAQAIHSASDRSDNKFVAVNCAALPDALLDAELFGHEKGVSPGATYSRRGKFEQANGGSLFLDEIGEMSAGTQARFLHYLEEKTVERLGGGESIPVDVRLITASTTGNGVVRKVQEGAFRQDIFYRLKEVHLDIPPLRERKEDIPVLAEYFLKLYNQQYHREIAGLSDAALQFLTRHDWPGNIRELHHVIKCAVLMNEDSDLIWLEHIPLDIHLAEGARPESDTGDTKANELLEILSLDEAEKRHILRILESTRFNKSQAANILKISRPTLDRKIEKYQLNDIRVRERALPRS